MMLIGLAGAAGSGKDTAADYLVEQHGFTKFSFSDALYREVSYAFDVPISELQDRAQKEAAHWGLTANRCSDIGFTDLMAQHAWHTSNPPVGEVAFSPRWVLQHWGTEYRRAQDPDYWLKQATLWVKAWLDVTRDDGEHHGGLVNTSVRFPNEQQWVHDLGGIVWHVKRPDRSGVSSGAEHVSEVPLPVLPDDRVIYNSGTIEQLHTATSLLLQSPAGQVEYGPLFSAPVEHWEHLGPAEVVRLPEPPLIVACDRCGGMHTAYAFDQVEAEIAQFNEYFDGLDPESQVAYGGRHAKVVDYIGCETGCGSISFHVAADEELAAVDGRPYFPPVLYEELR